MAQATLVALYGDKDARFASLIERCQRAVSSAVGGAFDAYDSRQIHSTITGLEKLNGSDLCNLNLVRYRNRKEAMDLQGYTEFLIKTGHLPLRVQIGGVQRSENPFLSRGEMPFLRSFSIQDNLAVVIGWPVGPPHLDSEEADPTIGADRANTRTHSTASVAQHRLSTSCTRTTGILLPSTTISTSGSARCKPTLVRPSRVNSRRTSGGSSRR